MSNLLYGQKKEDLTCQIMIDVILFFSTNSYSGQANFIFLIDYILMRKD